MRSIARIACALIVLTTLAACAAGSPEAHQMARNGELWQQVLIGFWHGFIAPVTLIIEAINQFAPHPTPWKVVFFERDSGVLYDIGFYLGLVCGPSAVFAGTRR